MSQADVFNYVSQIQAGLSENDRLITDLAAAEGQWAAALNQATNAEDEVAKLTAEVESAKQEYEAWSAAADQLFGTLGGDAGAAAGEVSELQSAIDGLPDEKHITISVDTVDGVPNAKGNWSVPYDGFHAILHRSERVLTASQARKYRDGEGGGNGDVVAAIQGLRNDMHNIKLMVGRKVFGKAVVEYGGSRMSDYIGGADSRAASGYGT